MLRKTFQTVSIIVFHDNIKSQKNLKYALPRTLEFLLEKNFELCALPNAMDLKTGF
jgi:peptidoglycan-N-acetylglucosamine deacetylase